MKTALIVILLAILLGGGYYVISSREDGTATTTPETNDGGRVRGPEEVPMSVGDTKTVGDLSLMLNSIVSDSRCPVDVTCIQAGSITANITVRTESQITQNIDSADLPLEYDGYAISIQETVPVKRSSMAINAEEYVLTFLVAPTAVGDNI